MAAQVSPGLVIESLMGGQNDTDPPSALADDQVVLAENVEFWDSTLGERRAGMGEVDITFSNLDDEDAIVHLNTHLPLQAEAHECELWAVGVTEDTSVTIAQRTAAGVWSEIAPSDSPVTTFPDVFKMHSQSIHGKWFVMFKSGVDRAHVWDGTRLRRVGLAMTTTGTVTAADSGVAGAFTGDRIYRIRWVEKDGDTVVRRSEPSEELTFTPSGADSGAIITRVLVPPGEGETHWEIEASGGDGNFYVLDTIVLATTTYTDTVISSVDYPDAGELSEDIGEYDVVPSFKFVKADQDRLIFANQWDDDEKGSRIAWTPVWKDPGVGNDERIPADSDNFLDLDWMDGGNITDLSDPLNGSFYAFKWQRIYKLQRTGRFDSAYQAFLLSTAHGAIEGSVVSGVDEYGKGCVYFLDPCTGPMRIGVSGVQYLDNIRGTWKHVNTNAANCAAHGVYYPDKKQVHWWVATDGTETPNYKLVLQVTQVRSGVASASRGWTVATGAIANAYCSTIVPQLVDDETTGSTYLAFLPYAGFADPHYIQRCDIDITDNGVGYRARIVTKPYIVAGLLNKWGAMNAALLAEPLDDDTLTLDVKFIRDFGKETNMVNTDFVPEGSEDVVNKIFDQLVMSNAYAIQLEFSDPA